MACANHKIAARQSHGQESETRRAARRAQYTVRDSAVAVGGGTEKTGENDQGEAQVADGKCQCGSATDGEKINFSIEVLA